MRTRRRSRFNAFELSQCAGSRAALHKIMVALVYKCPTRGLQTQAWFAEEVSSNDEEAYEIVQCLACSRMHLVSRTTGRTLDGAKRN